MDRKALNEYNVAYRLGEKEAQIYIKNLQKRIARLERTK